MLRHPTYGGRMDSVLLPTSGPRHTKVHLQEDARFSGFRDSNEVVTAG